MCKVNLFLYNLIKFKKGPAWNIAHPNKEKLKWHSRYGTCWDCSKVILVEGNFGYSKKVFSQWKFYLGCSDDMSRRCSLLRGGQPCYDEFAARLIPRFQPKTKQTNGPRHTTPGQAKPDIFQTEGIGFPPVHLTTIVRVSIRRERIGNRRPPSPEQTQRDSTGKSQKLNVLFLTTRPTVCYRTNVSETKTWHSPVDR